MAMYPSWLLMLLLFLGGGDGNELLDYLPSRLYWKVKGVELTPEAMLAELNPAAKPDAAALILALGDDAFEKREKAMRDLRAIGPEAVPALRKALESDNAEIRNRADALIRELSGAARAGDIRRLMAIRALGELKAAGAEQALQGLLASVEPFVADYARTALSSIRGQERPAAVLPAGAAQADLALLPAACGAVGRTTWPAGRPVDYDALLKAVAAIPFGGEQPTERQLEEGARQAIALLERIGNARIDAVTLGVSAEIGDRIGFVVVSARGRYDAKALRDLITPLSRLPVRTVEGVEVVPVDREVAFLMPSDERLVFVAGPSADAMPLEEIAKAARAGASKAPAPDVASLAAAVDTSRPFWISARVGETWREAPLLAPFDAVTLVVEAKGDTHAITLAAKGKDAEAVKAVVATFEKGLQEAREGIARAVQELHVPQIKAFAAFMESVAVKTDGATVTVTGTLKGGGGTAAMLPWLLFGVRGEVRPR
jgi:hypothetical protein